MPNRRQPEAQPFPISAPLPRRVVIKGLLGCPGIFIVFFGNPTGRDCDADMVAAHKWFNIAAIKGSTRAAELRSELSASMSKSDIATALREAREWMTMH